MSKLAGHLLTQLVMVSLAGSLAIFPALILAGAVGGVALGVAPETGFAAVSGLLCGEGEELVYSSVVRSYHEPGEREPRLVCVSSDGTAERDVLLSGILAVLGLIFLLICGVLFGLMNVPLAVLGGVIVQRFAGARQR